AAPRPMSRSTPLTISRSGAGPNIGFCARLGSDTRSPRSETSGTVISRALLLWHCVPASPPPLKGEGLGRGRFDQPLRRRVIRLPPPTSPFQGEGFERHACRRTSSIRPSVGTVIGMRLGKQRLDQAARQRRQRLG